MLLRSLETVNFRNLEGSLANLSDGINLLYGENAAGKTNTLEAMFLFASGKSFRTRSEKDLIRHGESFAKASITYDSLKGSSEMSVAYAQNGAGTAKRMTVNGYTVERVSEFLGSFRAVLFTPDHLSLVKGSPEERRKLIDIALCQIKPRYVKSLNEYSKLLETRNAYLKSVKYGAKLDKDYLDVLNSQLSASGAVIIRQRSAFSEKLSDFSSVMYEKLTDEKETLNAKYVSSVRNVDTSDEKSVAGALYNIYSQSLERDISLCRTFCGPHRDELMIFLSRNRTDFDENEEKYHEGSDEANLGEYAARTFGSQGQQRSAVLAIKLAEGEIIKELTGEYPVFLLDDLFSELDEGRKARLAKLFLGRQSVITGCDRSGIPPDSGINLIHVENGGYKQNSFGV